MLGPGSFLTPSLRLVRPLGQGGMGAVWVAEHLGLRTQVVVKFMRAELAYDSEAALRFSREAAAAANVKSPHVVQMLDHGIATEGTPYIVMELLDGQDLAQHLARRGSLTAHEVDEIVSQVCKALGRAHERGIVHRDVKPQNVFLCNVGQGETFVKVLDFGVAKAAHGLASVDPQTRTGALLGSPYYMSPEQLMGQRTLDFHSDLWSIGVVAFECLTGRRPFAAEQVGELAIAILHAPLPMPSQVAPALGHDFDAWFAKACARDPAARFASAKELADAFRAAAQGRRETESAATIALGSGPLPLPQHSPGFGSATTTAGFIARGASAPSPAPNGKLWSLVGIALLLGIGIGVFAFATWRADTRPAPNAASSQIRPDAGVVVTASVASVEPLAPLAPSASAVNTVPSTRASASAPSKKRDAAAPASPYDRNGIE